MQGFGDTKSDDEKSREELISELRDLRSRLAADTDGKREDDNPVSRSGFFRAALDATPALVAYVDADQHYRYVNSTYTRWFGRDASEIVGRSVKEVLDPEAYAVVAKFLERVFAGEDVLHRNVLRFADGSERAVEAHLIPRFGDDGAVVGYFSLVFDTSEQVAAETAQRQSEERYRSLLEICPDAVYVHRNFELLYMNPAGAAMFGVEQAGDVVGSSLMRFITPAERETAEERYRGLMEGRPQPPREFVMQRANGDEFDARAVMAPIAWDGEPAVMIVAHDSSNRKRIEGELIRARQDAEDARARMMDAVQNIPEGFAIFSPDERIEFYNSNYADVVWRRIRKMVAPGVKLEDLVREHVRQEFGGAANDDEIEHAVQQAMSRHRNLPSSGEFRRPDGHWVRQSKRRTADGRVVAVYADVTEAKKRQAQLAESEDRYRRVVEQSPDAILVMCDDEIVYANDAAVHLFGANSTADLIGRRPGEFRIDGEKDLPEVQNLRARGRGSAAQVEYQKRRRLDGTEIDVDLSAVRILWYGRDALLLTLRDVTARIRAQLALEESERRLSAAAANFPGAIYQRYMSPDGKVSFLYISRGIRDILGVEADEIIADANVMYDLIPSDMRTRVREAIEISAQNMTPYEIEAPSYTRSGGQIWLRSVARPRRHTDGGVIWDGVFLDLTERNHARQALQMAKDEAEAASHAKSQFLANVSHELRTPLNAIIGYAEVIRDEILGPVDGERYRQYAADIHSSGRHLLDLINDILDLSKVEAGKYDLDEREVVIGRLIEDAIRIAVRAMQADRFEINVKLANELPLLFVDETKFRQILLNLLSNAIKFTPEGGRIEIEVSVTAEKEPRIVVRDSGVGIAEEDMEQVLIPFGQGAEALRGDRSGTGLGLPLSKSLVEIHGGRFEISSAPGEGTEITIVLPATRAIWQKSFGFGGGTGLPRNTA